LVSVATVARTTRTGPRPGPLPHLPGDRDQHRRGKAGRPPGPGWELLGEPESGFLP